MMAIAARLVRSIGVARGGALAGGNACDGVQCCGLRGERALLGFGHAGRQACALEAMALSVLCVHLGVGAKWIPSLAACGKGRARAAQLVHSSGR
jgi:hypothetical protein